MHQGGHRCFWNISCYPLFLSDCPSLMLGIAIHCIQHSQAMLEHGVCELAHSFFHFATLFQHLFLLLCFHSHWTAWILIWMTMFRWDKFFTRKKSYQVMKRTERGVEFGTSYQKEEGNSLLHREWRKVIWWKNYLYSNVCMYRKLFVLAWYENKKW